MTACVPPDRSALHGSRPRRAAALAAALGLALACSGGSIEEIRALQDAGAYEESVDALRGILSREPDHAEASYRLGLALLRTGRTAQAVWPLKKASDTEEFGKTAGLVLASTLLMLQNYDEAIQVASRVLERDPENETALLTRANAALTVNRYDDALADGERLLATDPENLEALSLRAACLAKLGKAAEAEAAFDTTYELAKAAESPYAARSCVMRARFYYQKGERDRAFQAVGACREAHPEDPGLVQNAVEAYDEMERPDQSLALLRETLERMPGESGVRSTLANRLAAQGDLKEADALLLEGAKAANSPQLWSQLATLRGQNRDLAGARAALEEAIAGAQGDPEPLRFKLAELLVDLGELDEAVQVGGSLQEVVYRDIIDGRIALERGDPAGALEKLERATIRWPGNEAARIYAARAASELGDVARAMSELREATRIAPKESDGGLLLARLNFARGDLRTAAQFAKRHLENRGFTGPEAHVIYARSLAGLGEPDQAYALLDKLAAHPNQAGRAAAERARIARRAGSIEDGIKAIESAKLDLVDPSNGIALRELLQLQLESGQGKRAVALASRLAAEHPDEASLHALHGHVLLAGGADAEARQEFERALELDQGEATALAGLGQLAQRSGDTAAALDLFERAARSKPDEPNYGYAAAHALMAAGRPAEAEQRLRDLVHRFPELGPAANDLAWILAEKGESLDYALILAQRAASLARGPEVLDTLGWVQLRRGELEAAAKNLRAALELEPDYGTARYHLGLCLARGGDPAGAREAFRTALASGSFPEAQAARTELAQLEEGK